MADSECPSILFAQSLETVDYFSGEGIVTKYDHALLEAKCRRSSSEFESSLDLHLIVKELFRTDERWANHELIFQSLTLLGNVQGFIPSKIGTPSFVTDKVIRNMIGSTQAVD